MEWTRKKVVRDGVTQIELRGSARGSQVLVVVALDGYNYRHYNIKPNRNYQSSTKGLNVHLAGNGGLQMTFDEWAGMVDQVTIARADLTLDQIAKERQELRARGQH